MSEGVNLRYYWEVLRRRALPMVIAFCTVVAASTAVAILLPPVYLSQAKIIVESQQIPADLVRSTITGLAEERLQVIRQRVTSREVLLDIADRFQLYADRRPRLSTTQLVNLIRDHISIELFDLGVTPSRARAAAALTIAFTVAVEYGSAEGAGRVANEVVTLILGENVRARTAQASSTKHFLERETARRRSEVVQLETQIADFNLRNRDALPDKLPFQMSRLERATGERTNLNREIQASEEQERLLKFELGVRAAVGKGEHTATDEVSLSKVIDALRAELAQKLGVYTSNHPEIKSLRKQIAALTEQQASLQTVSGNSPPTDMTALDLNSRLVAEKLAAVTKHREFLLSQRKAIESQIAALSDLIARVPEVQNGLSALERQHELLRAGLADLGKKLSDAELGEKLEQDKQAESFQVIEQPIVPQEPIRPNRPLIMLAGFGVALAASILIVALLEFMDRSIRRSVDLVRILKVHPLVVIPYIVSTKEIRKNRLHKFMVIMIFVLVLILLIVGIHLFYMPLNVLTIKVGRWLQL